ncbi:nucleotide-diphospho-sugar transferase [Chytriomyces sp. MP71]|nr:nucleotide-diphospho-sugar transferase [Chytriomyces sp. MP71]
MTLLTSTSATLDSLDFYSANAILQAFMFLHYNETRFTESQSANTEFVVMITLQIAQHVRAALLEMGARLIVVPVLSNRHMKGHRYRDVFTKFQAWRLEGAYDSILYVDVDLLFLQTNPVDDLWALLEDHERVAANKRKPFFAAARDKWQRTINSGLLLFRPSLTDFKALVRLAETGTVSQFPDQTVLDAYWKNVSGAYTEIPATYNFMSLNAARFDSGDQIGSHFKFWDQPFAASYVLWQGAMAAARRHQLRRLRCRALVPVAPDGDFAQWKAVRDSGVLFETIALFSLVRDSTRLPVSYAAEVAHRQHMADSFAQALHVDHRDLPRAPARTRTPPLLHALRHILRDLLAACVSWVAVFDQHAVLSVRRQVLPLHAARVKNRTRTLGVYWDCAGTRAGGFWIHREAMGLTMQMMEDLDVLYWDAGKGRYVEGFGDEVVWKALLDTFAGSMAFVSSKWYLHQVPGSMCNGLLPIDAE